jgi:hypothetical protein
MEWSQAPELPWRNLLLGKVWRWKSAAESTPDDSAYEMHNVLLNHFQRQSEHVLDAALVQHVHAAS